MSDERADRESSSGASEPGARQADADPIRDAWIRARAECLDDPWHWALAAVAAERAAITEILADHNDLVGIDCDGALTAIAARVCPGNQLWCAETEVASTDATSKELDAAALTRCREALRELVESAGLVLSNRLSEAGRFGHADMRDLADSLAEARAALAVDLGATRKSEDASGASPAEPGSDSSGHEREVK